ncbi:MAG TPA: hypothetical protein VM819_22035 [Vicinamibacterales bacterium]|nr:hypothetical protein [Vicinamibacterales bacterium]
MSSSQFARSLSMAVGCGFVLLTIAPAAQAPDANFLVSLFAELRKTGGISPEAEKRIQPALESIASMSAAQLSDAMPTIVSALSAAEEPVQAVAVFACFAIVLRPDGSQSLSAALPAVVSLLQSPSERVTRGAVLVLLNARIGLRPDVMSRVVTMIGQRNRSAAERVPALAAAVGSAPRDPAVVQAVTAFIVEPLDAATKASVLSVLRQSVIDSPELRLEAISWLRDSDVQVKLGVISLLMRIGRDAVAAAGPDLEQIAQRENESIEVRAAAAKALETLR